MGKKPKQVQELINKETAKNYPAAQITCAICGAGTNLRSSLPYIPFRYEIQALTSTVWESFIHIFGMTVYTYKAIEHVLVEGGV